MAEAALVAAQAGVGDDDRRVRSVRVRRHGGGRSGRRWRRALRLARKGDRHDRETGNQDHGDRQQSPVAKIAVEVGQDLGGLKVVHGVAAAVAVEEAFWEPTVLCAPWTSDGAGPAGVAPAVRPWLAGVT